MGLFVRTLKDYVDTGDTSGLARFLTNANVQVDDVDEDGRTALIYAVTEDKEEAVETLLEGRAGLEVEDGEGCRALHHAAREGRLPLVRLLLARGAYVEAKDNHNQQDSWTPLLWAAYIGNLPVAEALLDAGADVNRTGLHHCTPLLWAAGRGSLGLVQLFLKVGAKVDLGDKYGTTPLIWACRRSQTEVVEALLEAGAQVDSTGMYSWSPLLAAVKGNFPAIVTLLLKHSPNVNSVGQEGLTPLAIACKEGSTDIVHQLLAAGAYTSLQDRGGDTNLILACKGGHKDIVAALLKKHARVDAKGKDGKTCLYWAVEKNHTSVVRLLLGPAAGPGLDLEAATEEGNTALLRSVKNRNLEIVQLLLDRKARVDKADRSGDTALHVAMRGRSKAIVELLLRDPRNSQQMYKPNRAGETPYNIDISNPKSIMGQVFGARKLNTNEDTENMLGYDLYSSALADILTEPSLEMPITLGLYAKWGSGKSFLLKRLREEMQSFARDWVDPQFHNSWLLLIVVLHLASLLGLLVWVVSSVHLAASSYLVPLVVVPSTIILCYLVIFALRPGAYKPDWNTLYTINVALAKKFNELKLLVHVVFSHPAGPQWLSRQEKAQPLKLFFTDQSKVSTSAGAENSVVQIIGSLYDALETTYGTFATRLYRAFRPRPFKSSGPQRLRRLCCIPYAALYLFSYCLLLAEVVLITLRAEVVLRAEGLPRPAANITLGPGEQQQPGGLDSLVLSLLIALAAILGIIVVANIYTLGRALQALLFSQRAHLQRAVARHDMVQSEGYLQAVKREVTLLQEMVKSLDAFSGQQSRLIVVVDGLDSVEQRKVLSVLDTVHTLFSDPGSPFIIVLAIDPHVIIKAIELNLNQAFSDTSIGGHAYLRNMVHLPFFLQNAGLRKVKAAQQIAQRYNKPAHCLYEKEKEDLSRRPSLESNRGAGKSSMKKKKLSSCESAANSVSSNLNRLGLGQAPQDITMKMFLTDDYYSDVNPRSMRRLMNVIYVMGRLLKAFNIEFNWHHLSNWANITEQWPYRTSWITLYVEHEDKLEDGLSLKQIYDRVRPTIPTQKEAEPLLEMDRDEKKLDVFLNLHRKNLTVADMKIFLPFTINLDPFIKKVIKDEMANLEELGAAGLGRPQAPAPAPGPGLTRRQAVGLSRRMGGEAGPAPHSLPCLPGYPPFLGYPPYPWPPAPAPGPRLPAAHRPALPRELQGLLLSSLSLDQVCLLLRSIDRINASMVETYCHTVTSNNVTGRVLLHCSLDELRNVINMNFGDWELFKLELEAMREEEHTAPRSPRGPEAEEREAREASHERQPLSRSESKFRQHKLLSSMERQVAMEEATVSGLLSTLNEEAKEDILQEEINTAKEEAVGTSGREAGPEDESDYLYYAHTAGGGPEDARDTQGREEEGLVRSRLRSSGEIIWSASISRHGSVHDLATPPASSPGPAARPPVHGKRRLDMADRAKTAVSLTREEGRPEEDPYAWLSVTAPASPRSSHRELKSQVSVESRESDPGSQPSMSLWPRRSVKRTKSRTKSRTVSEASGRGEGESGGEEEAASPISRAGSMARLGKVKRRIQSALGGREAGQLPAVRRARQNPEEYQAMSKPPSRASSLAGSLSGRESGSEESLPSPEQRTVTRRLVAEDSSRPTVQTLFESGEGEERRGREDEGAGQ